MRRRLLITYLTLLGVVLLALTVPLGVTIASRDSQAVFIDRLNDTARFAALAEPALRSGRTAALQAEIAEYDRLYHVGVAIVTPDNVVRLASRSGIDPNGDGVRQEVAAARSGTRSGLSDIVWPWQPAPLVVAEPVGVNGQIIGVAVTVSPTAELRASIWREWVVVGAIGLLVLLVGAAAAVPITRWLARPLNELDEVTHAISRGRLAERVHATTGPPELRRFATSFNDMADQVAGMVERQRGFISYASHQLRTPLATVRLRVENLADSLAPDGAEDHRLTLEEVDRLSRIFEALLTFARAGTTATDLVTVDAAAVADERVAAWQPRAEAAGLALARTGTRRPVRIRAASETLDQVLDALIDNAVKFAQPGGTIDVTVRETGDRAEVSVSDDGAGMSADSLSRATQPFWRQPTDRGVAGAGLGLAIANALVAASGGNLELATVEPHGIRATISLPAADRPPAEAGDGT